MQPLTLHIQGLHSFRGPARIDLARLGEHGLFGVFGPIGSGKSTLLDAITLALYGQVDRLQGRSRKGIVNNQAKRCEVRFRFLVGETMWETQRAYRRLPDGNAQRIHSRIGRVVGNEVQVVADKEREVNARVERLLGLNAADFMRAVVLPQGRFMQFLQLQGTERRRMLQRIFHLEPFGEGLRHAVKAETTSVERRLERVLGELEGLGGAGPEAVDEAQASAREAEIGLAAAIEAEAASATAHARVRRAHEHHVQLGSARARLAEKLAQESETYRRREAIHRARVVRPLIALAREARETEVAEARSLALAEEASRAFDAARQKQREALARRKELLDADVDTPALQARQRELRAAAEAQRELTELATRVRADARKRAQLDRRHSEDRRALAELEQELETLVAERTALRARSTEITVPNATRERMQRAEANRVELERARERGRVLGEALKESRAKLFGARGTLHRMEQGLDAGRARRDRLKTDLLRLRAQADALEIVRTPLEDVLREGLVERLEQASDQLVRAEARLSAAHSDLTRAEAEFEDRNVAALDPAALAGLLTTHLDEGACPVCGSHEHPHPAPPVEAATVLGSVDARARALAGVEAAKSRKKHAEEVLEQARRGVTSLESRIPDALGSREPEVLAGMLARLQQATRALTRVQQRTEHQIAGMSAPIDEARTLVDSARAAVQALETQERRDEAERHASLEVEGVAWGAMMDALGDVTVFDLPRVLREIREQDREREQLAPRLQEAEQALERVQDRWERRRQLAESRQRELEALDRRLAAHEERRTSLLERLQVNGAGTDPQAELERVARKIAEREAALQEAQTAVEDTTREVLAATDTRARQEAQATAGSARSAGLAVSMERALDQAGLTEVPPEEEALAGEDLDALEETLSRWFQEVGALRLQVEALEDVDLPATDATDLSASAERLSTSRARLREAEDRRARTAERARALSERADRHRELDADRAQLVERSSRLDELSRLLRGDRFVEFVANDYLADLVHDATEHLALLTRGRYALDLDDQGAFLIADLDAGGATRPATSLSGGETFLASLALALALSTQVQRHNANALELFFLDEGFGSLDPESLDRVMTAIEALSAESRMIGLISHVGAVRERVPRRLELHCPRDGSGTVVRYREA